MLAVVKKEPTKDELTEWLATTSGFIQGATSTDERPTKLYDYQVEFIECESRFRAILKGRQTGFSFAFAAEALAKAHLKTNHTAIFVSYNLEDAKEKIRYARMLYETIPLAWQKKLATDNRTELEFADGRGRTSRLISSPCRESRGKSKADVYLDEIAFYRNSRRIYVASMPIITRGGVFAIASTPLGKLDVFYEIVEGEAEKYSHFARFIVPWWRCPDFCLDVTAAERTAEDLSTDERVDRFATEILKHIRYSMDLESFQQEYECAFIDEASAFIPWELILEAAKDEDELCCFIELDRFIANAPRGELYGGFDVGRKKHASELVVVERVGERFYTRLVLTLEHERFQDQRDRLQRLLATRADVRRLCIDSTGLGMQLAEELVEKHPMRVEAVNFTTSIKNELGGDAKVAFEGRNVWIPANRDLMRQIHSVKKFVTVAGNIRLNAESSEKHHADRFWALALALHAGKTTGPQVADVPGDADRNTYHAARRRSILHGA